MSSGTGIPRLAELLELLKQRSGRSYTALAHRTGLSRSTLHRYCLGTTVPRSFGAVEKVARVCGANREELDALYRAWCEATDERLTEDDAVPEEGLPDGAVLGGVVPEGAVPEGVVPDAGLPERAVPGGVAPEGGVPDGAVPDAGLPGSAVPEGAVRERDGRFGRGGQDSGVPVREGRDGKAAGQGAATHAPAHAPAAPADAVSSEAAPADPASADAAPADPASADAAPTDAAPADPVSADAALVNVAPADAVPASGPARSYRWLRAGALLLAFVLPSAALLARSDAGGDTGTVDGSAPAETRTGSEGADGANGEGGEGREGGEDEQEVRGPDWSIAPQRLPASFYGVSLGSDTGEMPGFRTGSIRLWHSGTRWSQLEPRRGEYQWKTLDRLTDAAERRRLPVLFTLGGTPHWAAPKGPRSVFADARAAPPDDLADWDRFVGALASRYRGRVEAYELWDYPSDPGAYRGSLATLAEMVERAARIIREADPEALVACPSFGSLWEKRGRDLLRRFIRTGAYEHCDVAALKLPPRRADGPPEEAVTLVKSVQRLFYSEGRGRTALWNTGPDSDVALRERLSARRARDYAVRFYLVGLYAKDQGLRRTYIYSWGSPEIPLVIELAGGPPTEAGRRIGRLQGWLDGASIVSCGSGTRMGLAKGAYTCRFARKGTELVVYWTTRGSARIRLGEGARLLRSLDGTRKRVSAGDPLRFGEEPVLVELRRQEG